MEAEKNIKQPPSSLSSPRGPPSRRSNHKKLTRNPYLNYLNEFRKRNPNLPPVETIRRGALEWKDLPKERKIQYIEAAFYAPKSVIKARESLALFSDCGCKRRKKKRLRRHACRPKSRRRRRKCVC